MYLTKPSTSSQTFHIKLPWDSNTAKSYSIALVVSAIALYLFSFLQIEPIEHRQIEVVRVPIELINLGKGDGTGKSAGNLAEEGRKARGNTPKTNIDDTEFAQKNLGKTRKLEDAPIEEATRIIAVKKIKSSKSKDKKAKTGKDLASIGSKKAPVDEMAMGLGTRGIGRGKGHGLGDISWGGGGSRTVIYKEKPRITKKLRTSLELTFRITVQPDGTVSQVICTKRADPSLQRSVIRALKRWKFSPQPDNKIMQGIIPFKIIVS